MPDPTILVINTGSTSVKLGLYRTTADRSEPSGQLTELWSTDAPVGNAGDRADDIERQLRAAPIDPATLVAVGHRIVHGADRFDGPAILDASVEDAIRAIAQLAPLHNQAGLDGIAAARRVVDPAVPQVAVFDTTFHRTMPLSAAAYGGPYEWIAQGLRRYGFHGISHQSAARRAAEILQRPITDLRLVTCHLGGGCSIAAIDRGRSIDTTMGFTPLDGLVMATRSGAVDPGLILHLLRTGTSANELDDMLERHSGLLGLSGISSDLRTVTAAREAGDVRAQLAMDVFVHRTASGVGAMAAALGTLDALVFTGGIGEHSSEVRARVAARFAFAGVLLDADRNDAATGDADVSAPQAAVQVLVVKSREDLAIAEIARRVCSAFSGS